MKTVVKALAVSTALAAVTLLSGCATPTPYQPAQNLAADGYHPGYSDTKLEDNRYRIVFAGNDTTPRETVENYLLYHAAEVTLSNGYDWFEVVKRASDAKTRTVTTYDDDPFFGGVSWRFYRRGFAGWGAWGGFNDFDRDTMDFTRYQANAEIVLHKGAKPDTADAYDARQVKSNLEAKIVRPTASH